jgi:hypothetical protein
MRMKMANKKPKSKINLPLPDSDAPQVTQVASEDTGDAPQPDDATSSIYHDTPAESVDAVQGDDPTSRDDLDDAVAQDTDDQTDDATTNDQMTDDNTVADQADEDQKSEQVYEPYIPPVDPAPAQKSPLGPMILGGAVCAVLGFGAAVLTQQSSPLWPQDPAVAELTAKTDGAVADLQTQIDAIAARPAGDVMQSDLTPMRDAVAQLSGLEQTIADLAGRVSALEQATIEAAIPDDLIAKYRSEVESISALLESQRGELNTFMQDAKAKADQAAEIAKNTLAGGALDRIATALDTGSEFVQAMQDYEQAIGAAAPDALASLAADGVVTLQVLSQDYADVARAALAAARAEMDQGQGMAKVTNFLKNQFNARSVVPKSGDDPDAVLSRAEQALRDGDLAAAMDEISKLGPRAQATMSDWIAAAQARLDAQNTVNILIDQLKN